MVKSQISLSWRQINFLKDQFEQIIQKKYRDKDIN